MESFEVEVSSDGEVWTPIHKGSFGNIRNDPSRRIVHFDRVHEARYLKLSNLKAPGDLRRVGAAEIDVLAE
ncbi:discoidin domain-containing protein [Geofilum rubicundum]|uniref:discoidin domain-containing protein n=1 Tax=Geofilum rubicundum TaxID=472113 RepID=UPI0012F88668